MSLESHSRLARLWQERVVADFRDFRFTWAGLLRWSGIVLCAFLAAIVVTLIFLDWNMLRGPISGYLSERYGRPVRILGDLRVNLFQSQPHISVRGLTIGNPAWIGQKGDAAQIADTEIEFRLWPLVYGHPILPLLEFDRPRLVVVRLGDGRTNWDLPHNNGGSKGWTIPPIQEFRVTDGQVRIDDAIRHLRFTGAVNAKETARGTGAPFLLEGTGTLNADKFTAEVQGGSLLHVDESKPYDFRAQVQAGPSRIAVTGQIAHPFHLGEWSAHVVASGQTLSELYDLIGIPLPGTPPFRLNANLKRDGSLYSITALSGALGDSDLQGYLTLDASKTVPDLRGRLSSRLLNFEDLGALLRGGKKAPAVTSQSLLPDVTLHTERLKQIDAEVDYRADAIKSRDLPLRSVVAHISVENGLLILQPLAVGFSAGKLAGALSIDARQDVPITSVDARISGVNIASFFKSAEKPLSGTIEARAKLEGRGNSVHKVAASANGQVSLVVPNGTMKKSLAEWMGVNVLSGLGLALSGDQSQTNLRCAVLSFSARHGELDSRVIVLDTDPTRIDGHGSLDLGTETVNLTLEGKPKHFQFLRLHAPIDLTGKLASPKITIDKKPAIAQGALAAGLGLLMPFAALAPFIDPGLAKNADCASILSGAGSPAASLRHAEAQVGNK